MQVYIELALAENFCMDFCLLYGAKLATKNLCSYKRIALAAALGACFAVVMPLFSMPSAISQIIKIAAGLILCAVGGKFTKLKGYVKFSAIFLGITFLLGGFLTAIFSFAGISYAEGNGFLVSSAPIGIPLFFVFISVIAVKSIAAKFVSKKSKNNVSCRIFVGQLSVATQGFYDSGNKVYHFGQPVSIVSREVAKKIIDEGCITESVKIHTVAGSKILKVFTADKIEIYTDENLKTVKNIKIGISPTPIAATVLHPDLSEVS